MLLIRPLPITPAMLTASNGGAADADYNPATSYALLARVYLPANGWTYECVQAPALDKYPPSNPLHWRRAEPSNRWAMWDAEISSQTRVSGGLTATLVVPPRYNAVGFYGLTGSSIMLTQKTLAGAVLWTQTRQLRSNPSGWYSYFFEPRAQTKEAVFLGLVPAANSRLEVSISGSEAGCAAVVVGNTFDLGQAAYGFVSGIVDYSRKTTTAAGAQTFESGRYSKRVSGQLHLPAERYNAVSAALASVRAIPCGWVGVPDSGDFEPLNLFGVFRDFQLEVSGPSHRICSIEIESLTES